MIVIYRRIKNPEQSPEGFIRQIENLSFGTWDEANAYIEATKEDTEDISIIIWGNLDMINLMKKYK